MTEKQLLYVNLGGVIAFGLFVLISLVTAGTDSTHGVMVLISELIGGVTLIGAIISLFYIKSDQRFVPVSIISFLSAWLVFAIGYEIGIDSTTNQKWIWFFGSYIVLVAGFILMRLSYAKIQGAYKLLPAFLLFFNSILSVFILFFHIWWNLPFVGK